MKIVVICLLVLVGLLGVLSVVIAMQPSEYRIERSATMSAPATEIFPHVNDLHQWGQWSAWDKIDPKMTKTFEGPEAGKDSSYSWVGNNDVGEGKMTIIESRPDELVRIKLEFFKPMSGAGTAELTFQPEGDQTKVTWAMFGPKNFLAKAIHLCMNMDKMIGDKYEESLAALKSIVESKDAKQPAENVNQ